MKKIMRDDGGVVTDERREQIKDELGDVLWYAAQLATELGLELDEIPVIAPKFETPLEPGVVMAVEPKVFYPGLGGVGVENTYVITEKEPEKLTLCPQDIYTL